MKFDYIVCGKLDNRTDLVSFSTRANEKVRLQAGRMAPNRRVATLSISVGEKGIWFDGRHWEQNTFLTMAAAKGTKRLLVLTNREYLQIVEQARVS